MDSNLWKLNDRKASEFAKDIHLSLYNQEADQLTFNVDGEAFDSAALYAYGESISLYKGSVRWFAGVVISGPRFGNSSEENHAYEAIGLWWYLENISYEQQWAVVAVPQTHVTLGRDDDNEIITLGAQVKDALDFAITKGAPFTYVEAELTALDAKPPTDEQTDLMVSEVITKILRWVPDTVAWFDYAPATPVLHFTRRAAAAAAVQLPIVGDAEEISIRDRADLIKTGIIINYERTDMIDGERIPTMQQDIFPVDTVSGFTTLTFTINIAGQQIASQSVEVEVDEERDENFGYGAFWQEYVPELADKTALKVSEQKLVGTSLPNILLNGQVPEWTNKSTSEVSYTAKIGYEDASGSKVEASDYEVSFTLTDAETKTYRREISVTDAEPYPTGLAEALYNALSIKHWQGQFSLVEEEVSGSIHPGQRLNLTGGHVEWTTMNAVVQQVEFDLDSGRTSILFGPPERLGLTDTIALLNANRSRITHYSSDVRKSGKAGGGADLPTGGGTPNSSKSGGAPRYSKIVLADAAEEAEQKKVTIDTATMKPGRTLVVKADGKNTEWGYERLG